MSNSIQVQKLFDAWVESKKTVEQRRSYLNAAETQLLNDVNQLGRLMLPDDINKESVCFWSRLNDKQEVLVQIERSNGNRSEFKIEIVKRVNVG